MWNLRRQHRLSQRPLKHNVLGHIVDTVSFLKLNLWPVEKVNVTFLECACDQFSQSSSS